MSVTRSRVPSRSLLNCLFVVAVWAPCAFADSRELGVQATLLAESGEAADGDFTLTFRLYDGAEPGANVLWSETIADIPVVSGQFDTVLGVASPLFAALFSDNPSMWLAISVDAGPGVPIGGEAELPRRPLTAVAYAFTAERAGTAADLVCEGCVGLAELDVDVVTQAEFDAQQTMVATALDDVDAALTALQAALAAAGDDAVDLEARVTAVEGSASASAAALATLQGALAGVEAEVALLGDASTGHTTLLAAHAASLESLGGRLDVVEGAVAAAVQEFALFSGEVSADVAAHGTRLTALEGSSTTQAQAISGLDTRVTAAEGASATQAQAISGLDTRVTAAEGAALTQALATSALDTRLLSAEASLLQVGVSLSALQDVATELDGRMDAVEADQSSMNGALTTVTTRVDALETLTTALDAVTTLDDLACSDGQLAVKGPAGWGCMTPPVVPPAPPVCTGSFKALQWDGATWSCAGISTGSGGVRGVPFSDPWGNVFDGDERKATSFDTANGVCLGLGARLPTVTELWRVSWARSGDLGSAATSSQLWTIVRGKSGINATRYLIKLSDAAISEVTLGTGTFAYRCIWPVGRPDTYSGAACNGPPGSPCLTSPWGRGLLTLDAADHAPLDIDGAQSECTVSGALLPPITHLYGALSSTAGLVTVSGKTLVGSDGYLTWPGEVPTAAPTFSLIAPDSSLASFRCLGATAPFALHPNTLAGNLGSVFTDPATGTVSHATDLPNFPWQDAVSDCQTRGGALPDAAEWRRLTDLSLPSIAGKELWAAAGRVVPATQFVAAKLFSYYGNTLDVQVSPGVAPFKQYRCLFRSLDPDYAGPPSCNAGTETCFQTTATGTVPVIRWADPKDRFPNTLAGAVATCAAEGGRLPSYGELVALIRQGLPNGSAPTKVIWTTSLRVGWAGTESGWTARIASATDGGVAGDTLAPGSFLPYRCVWSNERL
ncbi:MAG: hypothetical protein IV100_01980 [Myxococcales bacterium]|nr:hypothetical protein [Myxococcales bacterium]